MAASDAHTYVYYACTIAARYFVLLVGDKQESHSLPLVATSMGACMAAGHLLGLTLLEHYVSNA